MCGNQRAPGQEVDLVVNVRRPPGIAPVIDFERQPRKIFKAITRADFLDSDALCAQLIPPPPAIALPIAQISHGIPPASTALLAQRARLVPCQTTAYCRNPDFVDRCRDSGCFARDCRRYRNWS